MYTVSMQNLYRMSVRIVAGTFIRCAVVFSLIAMNVQAAVYHVDIKNITKNGLDGQRENAFGTIQQAVDRCEPGDTVVVHPGVYHEVVRITRGGTPERYIRILADKVEKDRVVISGAVKEIRSKAIAWECSDASLGLYRIPLSYGPTRVLADRIDVPVYLNLEDLKAFRFLQDDYPGHRHGFAWNKSDGQLYIRLRSDGAYGATNPNDAVMAVSPPPNGRVADGPNGDKRYLFSIRTPGAACIIIDGFTFEAPGWAAIAAESGDLTVRNCWFYGCRSAVSGERPKGSETRSSDRVVVEQCYFTQYPTFRDIEDTIRSEAEIQKKKSEWWQRIMHWQRKGGLPPKSGGVGADRSYEAGFTKLMGRDWTVRSNYIFEAFEGLSGSSVSRSENARIYANRFERICDQAVESEDHSKGLAIFENLVIDVFEPFSWQPLNGTPFPGPVFIHDNTIVQTPETAAMWEVAGNNGGIFKIGCKDDRNWEGGKMGDIPRDVTEAPGGFWVFHNTVYVPRGQVLTSLNTTGRKYIGFYFFNNIFAAAGFTAAPGRTNRDAPGTVFDHNIAAPVEFDGTAVGPFTNGYGPHGKKYDTASRVFEEVNPAVGSFKIREEIVSGVGYTERLVPGTRENIPKQIPLRSTPGALPFRHAVGPQQREQYE